MIEFGHPLALWLIPPGWILLVLLARRSAVGHSRRRARLVFFLRAALLMLLLGALSDPRVSSTSHRRHVIWAVDLSASVGGNAQDRARSFIREAQFSKTEQSLLGFGKATLPMETLDAPPPDIGPEQTNLARAAQFATASFPPGTRRLLVIFTDGRETEGSIKEALSSLAEAGVAVCPVVVPPDRKPDAMISALRLPEEAHVHEPFPFAVTITSTIAGNATLEIFHDRLLASSLPIVLTEGETTVELAQRVSVSGTLTLEARIRAPGDTRPQNDALAQPIQVRGPTRLLILNDDESSSQLAGALAPQGIVAELRPGRGLPASPQEIAAYDAVVVENTPASALDAPQMRALVSAVKDFGVGLLMLGGKNSFGSGGYDGTPLEGLLPLRTEFEKQRENPSVALVPVMDSSGSMSGEKIRMAASAAAASIRLLAPTDMAGVVAFDTQARWIARLQPVSNITALTEKILTLNAMGGTNIGAGLELAWEDLRAAPAKIRHIILLSDGISAPAPFPEIAARLAADGITLSTVGIGADADTALLEQLARWGRGRSYHADSPETIPQIFVRETLTATRPTLREEPVTAVPARYDGPLKGVNMSSAPLLLGYVSTHLQPNANLWLATSSGEPLLADWRVGLGTVAAFTSDARDIWAADWLAWEEFGKFWAQVLRGILRPPEMRNFPLTLERVRDGFRGQVEIPETLSLESITGKFVASGPQGIVRSSELSPHAPGQIAAWIPAPEAGPWLLSASVTSHGKTVSTTSRGASVGFNPEYLPGPPNTTLLETLAQMTGGVLSPTPQTLKSLPLPPQRGRHDLWPVLLFLATLVFVADVAARRWTRSME